VHLLAVRTPPRQATVFLDAHREIEDLDLLHDVGEQSPRQQLMSAARASIELMNVATTRKQFWGERSTLMAGVPRLSTAGALGIGIGAASGRRFDNVGRRRFGRGRGVLVLGGQLGLEFDNRDLQILDLLLQRLQLLLQELALRTGCCDFLHGRLP